VEPLPRPERAEEDGDASARGRISASEEEDLFALARYGGSRKRRVLNLLPLERRQWRRRAAFATATAASLAAIAGVSWFSVSKLDESIALRRSALEALAIEPPILAAARDSHEALLAEQQDQEWRAGVLARIESERMAFHDLLAVVANRVPGDVALARLSLVAPVDAASERRPEASLEGALRRAADSTGGGIDGLVKSLEQSARAERVTLTASAQVAPLVFERGVETFALSFAWRKP
jgi:hypothetical protein